MVSAMIRLYCGRDMRSSLPAIKSVGVASP
jgi:hypothetical protein